MRSNNDYAVALATFAIVVIFCFNTSYAHPRSKSNKPTTANLTPQVNIHYALLTTPEQPEQNQQQQQTNLTISKTSLTSTTSGASSFTLSTKSSSDVISAESANPSLQSTYIYKAEIPTHIEPEAKKVVNAVKLTNETAPALAKTSFTTNSTNSSNINLENDDDLSKKIIGSSGVTSVSVILNGDEPEFTNALGQKVPKPQLSLQVASPIDLLNPDRYEFYTFDEHGELVKRLMTMEEIQSIVANGDGEGPAIIHHALIEDRDPEKNVQDIVNSVQSVLNKEVESNKNTSSESLPIFDTPDVSSSWSMILPAIFGNTGDVDIFSHQKPQQIVMTPDTEIIETSTTQTVPTTTKKPKPSKRKPGQKRKSTTTTTAIPPQVIQEELDSEESVYTGMQQYQNLAATMQNYDGFSQLHMQPLYHKLPEIETSTRRVFINNQEVVKKPVTANENNEDVLNESLLKKTVSVQQKPLSPHRVKKPNRGHTTTKRPQTNKQKIKRKPTASTATSIPSTTSVTINSMPSTPSTTTTTTATTPIITTTTTTAVPNTSPTSIPTITSTSEASTTTAPQKKRKKPTYHPVSPTSTISVTDTSSHKPHLTAEKRKPFPKPHRTRPKPTKYQHVVSTSDLAAEGSGYQEISHNKFEDISYNKKRPKPNKPIHITTTSTTAPLATILTTTVIFSPTPTPTTNNPLVVQDFPGFSLTPKYHEEALFTTRTTTNKPDTPTSANIPSIYGTSGYPVPSYDVLEKLNSSQYKEQSSSSLSLTQHGSRPYEQDAHTWLSIDQILQSLKQPEQVSEKIEPENLIEYQNKNAVQLKSTSTLKPCYEHSLESTLDTTCADLEGTSDLSAFQKTTIKDESNVPDVISARPQYNLTTNIPEDNAANKPTDKESNKNSEGTDIPSITSFTPSIGESIIPTESAETTYITFEKQIEHNTEYNILKQEYQTPTQDSEMPNYSSTSTNAQQSTIINGDEDQVKEDSTEPLSVEVRPVLLPHKDETSTNYESSSSHPILIANLKSQLNMEVINPSELITMSDFQTHAATVASTLIDGVNTSPSDYSLMSSNETRDEIALLLSDVIHQISKNDEIPPTKQTNDSDNRFSNQALLDLSFLMNPTKGQTQNTASPVNNLENDFNYQQNVKPIYERLENTHTKDYISENLQEESTKYFSTSKNPETTTITEAQTHDDFYNETERTTAGSPAEEVGAELNILTLDHVESTASSGSSMSVDGNPTSSFLQNKHQDSSYEIIEKQTGSSSEYKTEFLTEKFKKNYNKTDNPEFVESETVTQSISELNDKFTTPSLLYTDIQHQKLEDERAPLFESDSSFDTTTSINDLSGETIDESQSSIEGQDKVDAVGLESSTSNESSENEFQSDVSNQVTTEFSNESDENITKRASTDFDLTEGFERTTLRNKDTKQGESYRVTANEDDRNDKEPTTSKGNEDSEESSKHGSEETTTTIYQISEETSAELNSMISEEDETDESIDEDPYIKLGETTTFKTEIDTQTVLDIISTEKKPAIEQEGAPPKPTVENTHPTETQPNMENYSQPSDESDEEDEEDQGGYNVPTSPNPFSTSTTILPTVSTTRRLSTLKPVSYFNKKPAYAIYQDKPEPIYTKLSLEQKEIAPNKSLTYSTPAPQQRPMQRPPQLSNLLISSTQATRPPVKLEPSPINSKGLESSLANSDEDILAFSKLCNELAFSYWQSITSEKISSARSLVISPFALTSMLSMVFLGARGSTSGEMNDVLKLDDMVTFNPHLVFKNITDSIEKSVDSDIATTAFVREIYSDRVNGKVLQFFKEKTQQLYAGHVEEVNFHVVNDIIRRRTNLLVKRHTMGKVLEYLRTNSVWVNGPLATISANLFQTNCSFGSTQDRDGEIFFQVHPTVRQRRLVPIPGVLFKSGFIAGYEKNLDATVVAFGRIQDTTSTIYVMPGHLSSASPSDNLDRLEKQLMETAISKNAWSNLLTSLMERPGMEVQIPRFSHRSFVNATLGLQKMGLKGLFKSDYADLGGLTGSSSRDIYLSDMIQINTFSTCGEEKIADHHHIEMYPAPPLRKRNKNVDARNDDEQDSSEDIIDFGSLVQDSALGRGFYDDLLDPKYLELPLPLRPRQARVPDAPRLRFDKPFLFFVRHNPTGMILFMGRFNPRLLP